MTFRCEENFHIYPCFNLAAAVFASARGIMFALHTPYRFSVMAPPPVDYSSVLPESEIVIFRTAQASGLQIFSLDRPSTA